MTHRADKDAAARALEAFLRAVGAPMDSDPELRGTPERVAQAYMEEFLAGYREDPKSILAEHTDATAKGLVVVRDMQIATMCPHHLMPSVGVAHVGYVPGGRVVGFGALARLLRCFAARLSLQETLGEHVAEALVSHLGAAGAACVLELESTCLTARGERAHGARTVSHAFVGSFARDAQARAEFLSTLRSELRAAAV